MFDSRHSFLLSPSSSEYHSRQNEERIQHSTLPTHQPIFNPHSHLLRRTTDSCPQHLTGSQRNAWIKTGFKAKKNYELVSTLPRFQWPESYYEPPIHIHYRTPESLIHGLIYKLSNVRTYTIDTESDRPTRQNPHSLPALIQIQAIHHETCSTILLIEVQHLPDTSTSLFSSIQRLCRMIFSPMNKIMAWGNVEKELKSFSEFDLFDISEVVNPLNLQDLFTLQWNLNHPHTNECLARHQLAVEEPTPDDVLICLIDSDDLCDEYDDDHPTNDFNTCICPDDIRPYKAKNSVWSLQKAIQFVFHEALDKAMTFNFWSCGLDLSLHTWHTSSDKHTRTNLINYAITDLFAPTNLFYYIERTRVPSHISTDAVQLNSISPITSPELPSFLVITDSHGKFLPPVTVQSDYMLNIKAISGLQWVNPYNSRLCCKSLVLSSTFTSLITASRAILFIVGSNSIRTSNASVVLGQVEEILDLIRTNHPHLADRTSITISNTFPCFKPSSQFPTCSSLLSNIQAYNEGLQTLSLPRVWQLRDLKTYLKSKNIHHTRLPEVRHHQLRIQFNHLNHLQHAEQTLLPTDFDEQNYYSWISQEHSYCDNYLQSCFSSGRGYTSIRVFCDFPSSSSINKIFETPT
ncbi:unnamed protein product [Rotaria sp. Silwood1]|nr:unnamed protein product [Rotaria sp. Silwood1]CAF4909386.1 unnamed protein product [Rotaria sp. Silwood1]